MDGLGLDPAAVARWLAAEPDRAPGAALGRALTALSFRIPGLRLAEDRAATGAAPTYVYETTWRPPTPLGAVHAFDVPYVFDTIDDERAAMVAGGTPPRSLADDMAGAVVRFATTGDPGWPPYRPDDRREMAFDVPSRLRTDPDPLARALFSPLR
jgi:para-nitrobenzyl esterase